MMGEILGGSEGSRKDGVRVVLLVVSLILGISNLLLTPLILFKTNAVHTINAVHFIWRYLIENIKLCKCELP